ncbi:threonine aldolase family protein [Aquimarina sp. 2304DJ70-9]|uniref:threonine aldolase family protein n=1 Tax=Aquimarina penaris TaxID=3231044 RepID=UPI003462EE45
MNKQKQDPNRRDFLKKFGFSTVPFLLPTLGVNAMPFLEVQPEKSTTSVNFIYDGLAFSPEEYIEKLNEINKQKPIEPDFYGNGGETKLLELEFAKITGKEKAIYLPTGTMANQLAIKLLNGNNTKVIVPENSHVYRDEADAAQSVHNKRLIPIGKTKSYFELNDLEEAINYANKNEVFKSGLGTVVIENPVRRADGTAVPIETIKEVSKYCKENGYKMHLDGARIHLASAYTDVSLLEYASYFDTVYISLYKYLNATGGAILCGKAKLIDQISHQIKIYGGTVFQNWNNTSMASHYLKGIEARWKKVIQSANHLISELNNIDGVTIKPLKNGTNIYNLKVTKGIDLKELAIFLYNEYSIWLGRANEKGIVKFTVNESILTRDITEIVGAWKKGVDKARG